MKKSVLALLMVCLLALSACGGGSDDPGVTSAAPEVTESTAPEVTEPPAPADLTGEWTQVNGNSEDTWQSATITADTIEIYWVSDGGDTRSLYWAGSFTAPQTADEPYTWESANDTEKTEYALLASTAESKTFTYEAGQISYEVSALGTTTTVRLEKVS